MTLEIPQDRRRVAAVIVNYRTADLVLRALDGLAEQCADGRRAEILIVDNCSPTNDADRLREALSRITFACPVRLIESDVNGGFGAGNNIALRRLFADGSAPEFVLFVNPDARLRAGALDALIARMDEDPRCGFAGPRIYGESGDVAVSAFRRVSILGEFEQSARVGLVTALLRPFRVPMSPFAQSKIVDWVSGAVFLSRSAALKDIGFFDERFFLYFEEADLMMRGRRKGWRTWQVPAAESEHLEGRSDPEHGKIDRVLHPSDHWYRSRARYFRKTHGAIYAAAADAARAAGMTLAFARAKATGRGAGAVAAELRRFLRRDYAKD